MLAAVGSGTPLADSADAALQQRVAAIGDRLTRAGLPAMRLTAGDEEWEVGPPGPIGATIEAATAADLFAYLLVLSPSTAAPDGG